MSSSLWPPGSLADLPASLDIVSSGRELLSGSNSPSSSTVNVVASILLFIFAGILEIGGGYLIWIGVRDKFKAAITIPFGCIVLIAYGFVPTLQPSGSFGRIFAVYGGFFIVLSYLWAYVFDGTRPDIGDYIGASIALTGVSIAWFWPR